MSRQLRLRAAALALLTALALTACSPEASPPTEQSPAGTVQLGALAEGAYGAPPATAPAPAEGKSVWIVSCGQNAIGCSVSAGAAKEAAETLGWKAEVCDGKLNEGGAFAGCIRQGVAAGVDAIITAAIDCMAVQDPLREADAAGITTINFWGFDCNEGANKVGDAMFTASVQPSAEYPTSEEYQQAIGAARAEWIIAASGGSAEIIELVFEGTNIGAALSEGFGDAIAECAGCTVHQVAVTHQTFGDAREIIESALLSNPDAQWISIPLDSLVLLGAAQAVASAPNGADLKLIGGEGLAPNLDLIREGQGQSAAIGQPLGWYAYGAIDTLNRVFAGEEGVPQGMSFQAIDSAHNLPAEGGYAPPVDYVAAYRAAWGR